MKPIKNRFRYTDQIWCFLLPAVLLLAAFIGMGFAPFGDSSVLIMDLSDQYVEFFCGLKQMVREDFPNSLFFSWGKSMGANLTGVFAYYIASPLSFLTLFCPNSAMPEGLLFLTVLKVGLCGLTMSLFLRNMGLRKRFPLIFLSSCYALMSYNIVYSMCLMWLDGVLFLPLVLWGTEKLLRDGKPALLIASLTLLFFSNYYISYMVGLFAGLFFLYRALTVYAERGKGKLLLRRLAAFLGSALLSACFAAALLLPTWYSLRQGKIGGNGAGTDAVWNYKLSEFVPKLFLGSYDSITNGGTPFLYCGIAVLMLAACYFGVRRIALRERIASAFFLLFLFFSTLWTPLDLAWHVFQYPNWFPYRYAFLISFFLIFLAARAIVDGDVPSKRFCFAAFPVLLAGSVYALRTNGTENTRGICLTVVFAGTYLIGALLYGLLRGRVFSRKRVLSLVLALSILGTLGGELFLHTRALLSGLDAEFGYEDYSLYHSYKTMMEDALEIVERNRSATGETAYAAVSQNFVRSINDPIGFGYRSASHYSSAYDREMNRFLNRTGYAQAYFWSLHFGGTLVSDSVLGVRYALYNGTVRDWANGKRIQLGTLAEPDFFNPIGTADGAGTTTVYRNDAAITAPFVVSEALLDWRFSGNYFEVQNEMLNRMCGTDELYFTKVPAENLTAYGSHLLITVPEDGILYAYFDAAGSKSRNLEIAGTGKLPLFRNESDCIQLLGEKEAGDTVSLTLSEGETVWNAGGTVFYVLRTEAVKTALDGLRQGAMRITDAGSGSLRGMVDSRGGVLFTSIPYDAGWQVRVDGKKAETVKIGEALLGVRLPAGHHEIRMTYRAQGAIAGGVISTLALLAAAAWLLLRKNKKTG